MMEQGRVLEVLKTMLLCTTAIQDDQVSLNSTSHWLFYSDQALLVLFSSSPDDSILTGYLSVFEMLPKHGPGAHDADRDEHAARQPPRSTGSGR